MPNTKTLNTRVQMKMDSEANFNAVGTTLVPLAGEMLIVMRTDGSIGIKCGNGTSTYSQLNFIDANILSQLNTLSTNYTSLNSRVTALENSSAGGDGTEIIVSATQPQNQEVGSFWYKIIS